MWQELLVQRHSPNFSLSTPKLKPYSLDMCNADSEASDHQDRPSCLFISDLSHRKCVCRKNRMPPHIPLCLWMSSQRAAPDGSTKQTWAFGCDAAALLRLLVSAVAEVAQDVCVKIICGYIQISVTRSHDLVWKKAKMCPRLRFMHQLHVMTNHSPKTNSAVHLLDVCPSILSTAVQARL